MGTENGQRNRTELDLAGPQMNEQAVGKLFHGTSCSVAKQIIHSGGICPPASLPELAEQYLLRKAPRRPDPRYVYLIPNFMAIGFGVVRAVGLRWSDVLGHYKINPFVKGKDYDSVVVFALNQEDLNPSLFRESNLLEDEVAYEGIIDVRRGISVVEFPMTRKLYEFARNIQTPERRRQYVGMDLIEYLQGEQIEARCRA
jgi:hypothetical protein